MISPVFSIVAVLHSIFLFLLLIQVFCSVAVSAQVGNGTLAPVGNGTQAPGPSKAPVVIVVPNVTHAPSKAPVIATNVTQAPTNVTQAPTNVTQAPTNVTQAPAAPASNITQAPMQVPHITQPPTFLPTIKCSGNGEACTRSADCCGDFICKPIIINGGGGGGKSKGGMKSKRYYDDYSSTVSVCRRRPTSDSPVTIIDVCFSGQSTVQVKGQGATRLDELKIGDAVLTGNGSYSKIYSFGHYAPNVNTKFIQIHTNLPHYKPLEISAKHMLYVNGKLTPAAQVKVGDKISVIDSNMNKQEGKYAAVVSDVRTIQRRGAFAPLTGSGDIVVNGVVASNYIAPEWIYHHQYIPVPGEMLHLLQHGAVLPYQVFCTLRANGCRDETYDADTGFSVWVAFWFQIEQGYLTLNPPFRAVVLLVVVAPFTIFAALVGKMAISISMVAQLAALLTGISVWRYHYGSQNQVSKTQACSIAR